MDGARAGSSLATAARASAACASLPCSASTRPSEYCRSPCCGTRFTPPASTRSTSGSGAQAAELREVGAHRREVGVDVQCGGVVLLGLFRLAAPLVDHGEIQPRWARRARSFAPRCIRPARRRRRTAASASRVDCRLSATRPRGVARSATSAVARTIAGSFASPASAATATQTSAPLRAAPDVVGAPGGRV